MHADYRTVGAGIFGRMSGTFYRNIALLLVLNVIIKPIYLFGIEIPVQNALPQGDYGTYFNLLSLSFIFQILNDLGIQTHSQTIVSAQKDRASEIFKEAFSIKILLAVLYLILTLTVLHIAGWWQEDPLLAMILVCIPMVDSFALFTRSFLSSLGYYHQESSISIIDKVVMILAVGFILYFQTDFLTVQLFAVLHLTALFIAWIFSVAFLLRKIHGRKIHVGINRKVSWHYIKSGLPYALIILLMFAYTRIDSVMLRILRVDWAYQNDMYAASFRLYEFLSMAAVMFGTLLLPMFSSIRGQIKEITPLLYKALRLILVIAICAGVPSIVMGQEIINALYYNSTLQWGYVFQWLTAAFIIKSTFLIYLTFITSTRQTRTLNILLLATLILNIFLNYLLIPESGSVGAAAATLFTQLFVCVGCIIIAYNKFQISFPGLIIFKAILIAVIITGISWVFSLTNMHWFILFTLLVSAGVLISWISGLIDRNLIPELFRQPI